MAILTVQIPDSEIFTLSSIVEQISGSIIKVTAEEDINQGDCILHKDDLIIKNKLEGSLHSRHLWND
ncbi:MULTISPECIES: hypothetical protein [Mucilaginibacter]|jgi:hypothetical protein|uniref:Uncharacterized protein n=1 Tax=Mucilaginibacter rubeus TaxID=2027860 RepID=A0AAE6MIZ3_9SPHI|nr:MULTISPECIES: hypothetical protein [Mucilaginibacter]NVM62792.1 hypothetical protein [Mucilaginibacter sp. SG538B]QEM04642.1 hypothetical protein DIU31_014380 [Mucilaginibacter rubeus]QEM17235.1 hypothetical protein DIU38_014525 [Mucilaginibacter gossypii]QTE46259.1 hypothetical protein J3L19_13180 [Mucilaginibacter rubeus]QTE52856.1 hypothetical protein J3L21_13155 [Mucilaginibacter rubeus]